MNGQIRKMEKEIEAKRFYHFGRFTICTVKSDGDQGVGISRCSELDRFKRDLGESIAYGRALRSISRDRHKKIHSSMIA